ncbi:unnamed protein product [Meloidogyne enterolobii]|uniref:Uncharacterized protein n=1 Tax=Meloidogyne enterolobii TaxID=390850 RepID=A0ACB0YQ62_MELEN
MLKDRGECELQNSKRLNYLINFPKSCEFLKRVRLFVRWLRVYLFQGYFLNQNSRLK